MSKMFSLNGTYANIAKFFFDTTDEADEYSSIPTSAINSTIQRYSISKYVRPLVESEDNFIYCNDGYYGVVIECMPHIRMGTKTAETIKSLLDKSTTDIFLQITLFGSKNIDHIIDTWENTHKTDNETIKQVIRNYSSFYRSKINENITKTMETNIKNHRLFFNFKSKDLDSLKEFTEHAINILDTSSFSPQKLNFKQLKPIYYELLNPKIFFRDVPAYEPKKEFNRQVVASNNITKVEDTHIKLGHKNNANNFTGKTWITMTADKLPDYAHISDFGKKLGDYISQASNSNQFKDNFMVTLNINKLDKKENNDIKKITLGLMKTKGKNTDTILQDKKQEAHSVVKELNNFEPLFNTDLVVCVAGDTYQEAKKNVAIVNSFWGSGGETGNIKLGTPDTVHFDIFMSCLPLGLNHEYFKIFQGNPFKLFAKQVAQFAPCEADYKGNYPNNLLISKRGQIAGFDFFRTHASMNGYIVARSGAGKSALLNFMVFNAHTRGDRIFITDIGGSFESLCKELGGQYIEIDLDNPICFNPFSEIDKLSNEDKQFFSDWIYSLGGSKLKSKALELENIIKPKLQKIIQKLFTDLGNKMEITDIRDELMKIEDRRFEDFATAITPFCKGELYGEFLTGKSQVDLKNQLAVLELGAVENIGEIRDAMIFVWEYHKSNAVYKQEKTAEEGGRRILDITDEVHKFLGKNPMMDDSIEQGYRRYRKHRAAKFIATQGFNDINDEKGLTKIGKVILDNSPWKIFLAQEETSLNALFASSSFNFSNVEEQLIKQVDTIKGEYSELFLITPNQQKIPYRFILDRYFYYLITTDQDDKDKVKEVMRRENLSKKDAINRIIELEKAAA